MKVQVATAIVIATAQAATVIARPVEQTVIAMIVQAVARATAMIAIAVAPLWPLIDDLNRDRETFAAVAQ